MGRVLEGILIALRAIWSSKLRSFMSVLGNIVAVTSIIAVVSLIQGLNATVTDAIVSEVGADSFVVDRYGITRSDEDFELVRNNPRVTLQDATVALRIERRLKPKEKDNFGLFTSDSILAIYHQATSGIFAVLVGVVALSLLVGGIVIMNIMLMVVTERTFEIGLRKALGAKRRDIMLQVLAESVTLSVAGGVTGTALGFLAAMAISKLSPLPAAVQAWSVALGIGITAVVGLVFGVYPAMRAARLDPIEALRKE